MKRPREILPSYFAATLGFGWPRVSATNIVPSRPEKTRKVMAPSHLLTLEKGFTIGTAYITNGHEALEGTTYPPALEGGRHFVSRMITAQFDSIGYKHVLAKLKREVLEELWLLMQKRTETTFFTVYLVVFMMLHEISVACQDRRRRAREQGLKVRG